MRSPLIEQKCSKTSQFLKDPKYLQNTSIEWELTSNLFPESSPFREDPANWSKGSHNYPLKFKFVFEACALGSSMFSFSNHVLDGVELIRMRMGFQL